MREAGRADAKERNAVMHWGKPTISDQKQKPQGKEETIHNIGKDHLSNTGIISYVFAEGKIQWHYRMCCIIALVLLFYGRLSVCGDVDTDVYRSS